MYHTWRSTPSIPTFLVVFLITSQFSGLIIRAQTQPTTQPAISHPAKHPATQKLAFPPWKDPDEHIAQAPPYIVSLLTTPNGDVWAGSEDDGVCRYSPVTKTWTNYKTRDGLGDDSGYALACDGLGRIWAGHLNHGVSVFNGQAWRNYGLTDGPLGSRIFGIAVSPIDGDVWIATDAGLTRYSVKGDSWSYLTRAEGLASDQVNALAFTSDGMLLLGTQCDGIDIGLLADGYKKWRHVRGPKAMPGHATGSGLPTNLINALLVAHSGTIYAGTTRGLACSADHGMSWSYVRGKEWADKVKNSYEGAHPDFNPKEQAPLAEDYITALHEDAAGHLWIGYRGRGYEVYDPVTQRVLTSMPGDVSHFSKPPGPAYRFVAAFAGPSDAPPYIAHYGAGLSRAAGAVSVPAALPLPVAALPHSARLPRPSEVAAILEDVRAMPSTHIVAAYLGEDWRTQGDWLGRYGAQYAALTGMAYNSRTIGPWNAELHYSVHYDTGPHFPDSNVYTYIHGYGEKSRKVLLDPMEHRRVQAEANDGSFNSNAYPATSEGPDLWVRVQVPAGIHRISLYFVNVDSHSAPNSYRDFVLELKRDPALNVEDDKAVNLPGQQSFDREAMFALEDAPTLATARVGWFWGPVYKQFIVGGQGTYWIKIVRNHSFVTKLCGVFIDRLQGPPVEKEDQPRPFIGLISTPPRPGTVPGESPPPSLAGTPWQLWDAVDQAWSSFNIQNVAWRNRVLAYRAACASGADPSILSYCRWHLTLWDDAAREAFDKTASDIPTPGN
jgi:hypothetical protein